MTRPFFLMGLRGGFLGLPNPRPTTLRDLAGLERARESLEGLRRKWQARDEGKGLSKEI